LGFSKETIESELQHTAKLHSKNLGELAELAFMRKAASMGFAVAKPWGDSDRYDVIVRFENVFWRVQSNLSLHRNLRDIPIESGQPGAPYRAIQPGD